MIKYNKIKVWANQIDSMICDKCGKSYSDDLEIEEFHQIHFQGGYNSVFGDNSIIDCDICQHCLHDLIKDICRYS